MPVLLVGSLALQTASGGKACTGEVIGAGLVATAAHCVLGGVITGQIHLGSGFGTGPSWNLSIGEAQASSTYDFALVPFDPHSREGDAIIDVASGVDLPTPSNIGSFAGRTVTVVGFSDNDGSVAAKRRQVQMTISGALTSYQTSYGSYRGFLLEPPAGQTAGVCPGDSGGAVILDGKLVGVLSAKDNVPCGTSGDAQAAFIALDVITSADSDRDGVADSDDNCPTVANADQANCNASWDGTVLTGDVCDPVPCISAPPSATAGKTLGAVSLADTHGLTFAGGGALVHHGTKWNKARVLYRASAGTTHRRDVNARYCSCQDKSGNQVGDSDCNSLAQYCRDDDTLGPIDPLDDTGWQRFTWEVGDAPPSYAKRCPAYNGDGAYVPNDCNAPAPQRLFHPVYAQTTSLCTTTQQAGCRVGDYESAWRRWPQARIDWPWRKQDYPHDNTQGPYNPDQTTSAKVRIWLQPDGIGSAGYMINGMYTEPQVFETTQSYFTLRKPLYAPPLFKWVLPIQLDPLRHFGVGQPAQTLLLAPQPPGSEVDASYMFSSTSGADAQVGLLAVPLDASTHAFPAVLGSTRSATSVWPTTGTAVAQDGPFLFAFGGLDGTGQRSSGLWTGQFDGGLHLQALDASSRDDIAQWRIARGYAESTGIFEAALERLAAAGTGSAAAPLGRDGAVLVADLAAGHLVVLFGRDTTGAMAPPVLHDIESGSWLTITAAPQQSWLRRRDVAAQPDRKGSAVYVFGGIGSDGLYKDGLHRLALAPEALAAEHATPPPALDAASSATPPPRAQAVLALDERRQLLYLFGGVDAEGARADLWRFDLATGQWQQLSAGTSAQAPPAMAAAGLRVAPATGNLTLFPGTSAPWGQELKEARKHTFDGKRWLRGTLDAPLRASSSASQGQEHHFTVLVGAGARNIRVRMSGTHDADLYTRFGAPPTQWAFDCRPYSGGSDEACDHHQITQGDKLYVMVRGWAALSDFSVEVYWESTPISAANKVVAGEEWRLAIPVGAAATNIQVSMTGTNDADLYTQFGTPPDTSNWACRPYYGGSNESCYHATVPTGEMLYIMVRGWAPTSDFSLNVTWD